MTRTLPRLLAVTLSAALLLAQAAPTAAADADPERGAFSQIFQDGLSGGAVGGLVGLALLAFVDRPSDHLEYISTGAAVGVLAGVGCGIWRTTRTPPYLRPAVRLENGRWHAAVPQPELILSNTHAAPAEAAVLWRLAGIRF